MSANFARMVSNAAKENKTRIIEVDPNELIDDPENHEIYTEYDIDSLAKAMEENGFFGSIIAYPHEGKYKLESGHRRKYAAIKAGITKCPVMISEPPKDEIERRKRLVRANLHMRNRSTMVIAREAQYMYETYEQEKETYGKESIQGVTATTDRVANDLEISPSQVSRYRSLLKLIPELQDLIDKSKIPWAAFCDATTLNTTQQKALFTRVNGTIKSNGEDAVTASYLRKEIDACSLIGIDMKNYSFDRTVLTEYEPKQESRKKGRRSNSIVTLKKGVQSIYDSLDCEKSFIKNNQKVEIMKELQDLSDFLLDKISELEKQGFSKEFDRKVR